MPQISFDISIIAIQQNKRYTKTTNSQPSVYYTHLRTDPTDGEGGAGGLPGMFLNVHTPFGLAAVNRAVTSRVLSSDQVM